MKHLLLLCICIIAVVSCDDVTSSNERAEKILMLPKTIEKIRQNQQSYQNQGYTAVVFPKELTSIKTKDVNSGIFSFKGNAIRKVTMSKKLLGPKTDGSRFASFDLLQNLSEGGERTLFIKIHGSNETALFVGKETKSFSAGAYRGKNLIAIVINKPGSGNIQNYGAYSFADNQLKTVSLPRNIKSASQLGEGVFTGNPGLVKVELHLALFNAIKSSLPRYFGTNTSTKYYDTTRSPPAELTP